MNNSVLWYQHPAEENTLESALLLGNGSLGATLYGDVAEEHILINQESVWYGGVHNRINPDARNTLESVRTAIFEGRLEKAEELVYTNMFATPPHMGHYEPLSDLTIKFNRKIPHVSEMGLSSPVPFSDYQRSLDLERGLYSVSYQSNDIRYSREALVSYPDQVLAITLSCDKRTDLRIELSRKTDYEKITAENSCITLSGICGGNGTAFVSMAAALSDGTISAAGGYLNIDAATQVTIFLAGRTDFYQEDPFLWCRRTLDLAIKKGYEKIKADHITDVSELFLRMSLQLESNPAQAKNPTDQRLHSLKQKPSSDRGLIELFFNYGRYLLFSSSRKGSLPANLQGLWNRDLNPPWGSKYTININLEMNYWPAEAAGLGDCHLPLFDHMQRMAENGRIAASSMYGCRGVTAHHNTDIYGDCAPADQWMPATIWPMGFGWLGLHILEHFRYTLDMDFARKHYTLLEQICIFFLDYLVPDKNGRLVTCPTTSPENTYILANGEKSTLCYGAVMDTQIIYELWSGFLYLSQKLQSENETCQSIREKIPLLPPFQTGSFGQLLEWQEEYEEWEPGHRHISHLFGLYPGTSITPGSEFFSAAEAALAHRLSFGGGSTGWSNAWIINMYARLLNGQKAVHQLYDLFQQQTSANLLAQHPSFLPDQPPIFQIDGNLGATAGIMEMLLQSHQNFIHLLPALPREWPDGSIQGIHARNGILVSFRWKDHLVTELELVSTIDQEIRLSVNQTQFSVLLKSDKPFLIHQFPVSSPV